MPFPPALCTTRTSPSHPPCGQPRAAKHHPVVTPTNRSHNRTEETITTITSAPPEPRLPWAVLHVYATQLEAAALSFVHSVARPRSRNKKPVLTTRLHDVRLLGQHVTPEGVVQRQAVVTFSVVPFDKRTHRALTTTVGLRVDELRRSTLPGIGKVTGAAIVKDTPLTDRHGMLYRVSFTTEARVRP